MLPFHPLADLFPLIEGQEFEELVSSIKAHGLREPITLLDGAILDGRNRHRACEAAGIEPRFVNFDGDDPHAFVVDMNMHRRHLTIGQRAMIAARMANLSVGNPKLRMKDPIVEISTIEPTVEKAAQMLGVDRSTVFAAKKVLKDGTPEEIKAVETGKRSVSKTARNIGTRRPKRLKRQRQVMRDAQPVDTQHDRDLRFLRGAWDSACSSAQAEFLNSLGYRPTNHV